jgi:exopolysaccharide biosynthesis polyprenyl glycosylphosphotransferase
MASSGLRHGRREGRTWDLAAIPGLGRTRSGAWRCGEVKGKNGRGRHRLCASPRLVMSSTDELTAPAASRTDVESHPRRRSRAGQGSFNRPLVEACLLATAFLVEMIAPPAREPSVDAAWLVLFGACVLGLRYLPGSLSRRLHIDVLNELRDLVLATTLGAMIVLAVRVVVTNDPFVAVQTMRLWAFTTAFLLAGSAVLAQIELRGRSRGELMRPTLIVGAGVVGRQLAKRLLADPGMGLRPIGFLDSAPKDANGDGGELRVLGSTWNLEEVVHEHHVEHVVFAFSAESDNVLLEIARRCQDLRVPVSVVPRFFEKMTSKIAIDHIGGVPLISVAPFDPEDWRFRFKYFLDRVVAACLLVVLAPVLVACAVAVRLSVGAPILYRQRRVGLDGQRFEILKFRSMKDGDDEVGLPRLLPGTAPGGVEGEDRRTRVGKIMRRTSLDELPQLVNVLRGEMSLVGPRPERPEFAELFERDVYRYGERLRVKSGITGWAQVHGLRGQTSLEDRVEWDNYYIENWSFWLDLKILLLTVRAVARFAAD